MQQTSGPDGQPTKAEMLVAKIRAMPIEGIRAYIQSVRDADTRRALIRGLYEQRGHEGSGAPAVGVVLEEECPRCGDGLVAQLEDYRQVCSRAACPWAREADAK